jgi:hypothetical protein
VPSLSAAGGDVDAPVVEVDEQVVAQARQGGGGDGFLAAVDVGGAGRADLDDQGGVGLVIGVGGLAADDEQIGVVGRGGGADQAVAGSSCRGARFRRPWRR